MKKIIPKFNVGDVVTNISGLYPNVKPTISMVDVDNQCYRYKEIAGITPFEKQGELMLVNTKLKPKFKIGDRVKGVSEIAPSKEYVINYVNNEAQYYTYSNAGHITDFKDQNKLILVKYDEVRPPVEDVDRLDILTKAHAYNVKYNVLKYNIEHYPLIYNALKQIIAMSEAGAVSYHLVVPMKKESDEAGIYYAEDEVCGIIRWHFNKLDYKIEEKIKDNYNEFFITW